MDPEAPPGGGGAGGANAPPSKGVDILGALLSVGEMSTFTSKAGKEFKKRVVEIADDSGASIEMTIWGELAETFGRAAAAAAGGSAGPRPSSCRALRGPALTRARGASRDRPAPTHACAPPPLQPARPATSRWPRVRG